MAEEDRSDRYNDYIAVVQKGLLDVIAARLGVKITLPSYTELMYPETIKKNEDPEQIKAHILEKLSR